MINENSYPCHNETLRNCLYNIYNEHIVLMDKINVTLQIDDNKSTRRLWISFYGKQVTLVLSQIPDR